MQIPQVNDKVTHFVAFFLLAITFYWILDTSRRRLLNLTLIVVTGVLGLGGEIVQGFVTSRQFDPLIIAANLVGSLSALAICSIYHKRMLDRKRQARYGLVPQEGAEEDLEMAGQESGVTGGEEGGESTDGEGGLTPSSGAEADDEGRK